MFTRNIHAAFDYAAQCHAGQVRKGTQIPYLSHLMAVAASVSASPTSSSTAPTPCPRPARPSRPGPHARDPHGPPHLRARGPAAGGVLAALRRRQARHRSEAARAGDPLVLPVAGRRDLEESSGGGAGRIAGKAGFGVKGPG
jgi:hypothetical protein